MAATLAILGRSLIYGDQQELNSADLLINLGHTLVDFGESIHFLAEIERACTDRLARYHRPATGLTSCDDALAEAVLERSRL